MHNNRRWARLVPTQNSPWLTQQKNVPPSCVFVNPLLFSALRGLVNEVTLPALEIGDLTFSPATGLAAVVYLLGVGGGRGQGQGGHPSLGTVPCLLPFRTFEDLQVGYGCGSKCKVWIKPRSHTRPFERIWSRPWNDIIHWWAYVWSSDGCMFLGFLLCSYSPCQAAKQQTVVKPRCQAVKLPSCKATLLSSPAAKLQLLCQTANLTLL